MIKEVKASINKIIAKADRSLAAAHDHLKKGDADFASSKAYYAVFHSMQAILLTKKLSFSKHSGVIAAFNQHFVKTGIFPKEFSSMIEQLFKDRQIGDYGYEFGINKEEAAEDIEFAEKILTAVKVFADLKNGGKSA